MADGAGETDPLSPDERRLFSELEETIFEELNACLTIGRFDDPDGAEVTASLIADVVWTVFEVRLRAHPWRSPSPRGTEGGEADTG